MMIEFSKVFTNIKNISLTFSSLLRYNSLYYSLLIYMELVKGTNVVICLIIMIVIYGVLKGIGLKGLRFFGNVPKNEIRIGDKVIVENVQKEKRTAKIIQKNSDYAKIHYIGLGEEWDEWVCLESVEKTKTESEEKLTEKELKTESEYEANRLIKPSCAYFLKKLGLASSSLLAKMKLQFNRDSISFLFVGTESVGKSTMINAIGGRRFVNVKRKINTSSINYLKETNFQFDENDMRKLSNRYKNQTGGYEKKCKDEKKITNIKEFDFWVKRYIKIYSPFTLFYLY